ncbi:MAG TPA: AMP-binding protein [Candidatus Dormibacteraeota bacterium]|nr:AMP-binding protein [Candidatus Dormibacteraeota bacterium]
MQAVDFVGMHAATFPNKTAVIDGERRLDYATLNARAGQLANAFTSLGCSEGDRVAWMSFNSLEGSEISSALRRAGMVIVPVNYRLRGAEIAYVLNDSGARLAIAGPEHVDVMDAARPEVNEHPHFVAVGDHVPSGWQSYRELTNHAPELFPSAATGLLATMLYTSGTTGKPKGAWRPNGVDVAHVLELISLFELSQSDIHLMCGPSYHSAVGFFSAMTILLGGTLVIEPKFAADEALDLIEKHRVSTTFMAPTLLKRFVDEQEMRPRDTSSLRTLILSAAPCPYELKVRAEAALGQVLWEAYGATETGFNTILRPQDQLRKPGSCGTAVPGQEIRIVRDDGTEADVGEPGEFMVRTGWTAEYFNQPDATNKSLHDGFFSVGDVVYRDEEGYYYVCDRRIDMIISGGVNIYPAEIEAALHAHPGVMDVAVIGVPDDEFGESVKAIVQLRPSTNVTAGELIAFCGERLAGYKKPRSVDFVDELPRDAAGKLLKRKLREPYWAGAGRRI